MPKFIVEIPVGFNHSTEVEADNITDAIEVAIQECEDENPFMNLEYERDNAWVKKVS